MTKDEKFKMKVKAAYYYFKMRNFPDSLKELKGAGDMVLAEIKKEEEERIKKTNSKLL